MEQIPSKEILNKKVKVSILNKNGIKITDFFIRGGSNLWVFIRKFKIPIGSACSGVGVCGACCVTIKSNTTNAISPKNEFEESTLQKNNKSQDLRLSCLCRVYDDIDVQSDYW